MSDIVIHCDECDEAQAVVEAGKVFDQLVAAGWMSAIDPETGAGRHVCPACAAKGQPAADFGIGKVEGDERESG